MLLTSIIMFFVIILDCFLFYFLKISVFFSFLHFYFGFFPFILKTQYLSLNFYLVHSSTLLPPVISCLSQDLSCISHGPFVTLGPLETPLPIKDRNLNIQSYDPHRSENIFCWSFWAQMTFSV